MLHMNPYRWALVARIDHEYGVLGLITCARRIEASRRIVEANNGQLGQAHHPRTCIVDGYAIEKQDTFSSKPKKTAVASSDLSIGHEWPVIESRV
jgi:hypothetical protein